MKCSKTARLMTDMLAGELSAIQAKQLEEHLTACENCRKEFNELREIWNLTGGALQQNTNELKLSDAHRKEIFEAAAELPTLKLSKKMPARFRWLELAAGLIIGFIVLSIMLGMLLPALHSDREKARKISCESELKQAKLNLEQDTGDDQDRFSKKEKINKKVEIYAERKYIPAAEAPSSAVAASPVSESTDSLAVRAKEDVSYGASGGGAQAGEDASARLDRDSDSIDNKKVSDSIDKLEKGAVINTPSAPGNFEPDSQKDSSDGNLRQTVAKPAEAVAPQALGYVSAMRDEKSSVASAPPPPQAPKVVTLRKALKKSKSNPSSQTYAYNGTTAVMDKMDRNELKPSSPPPPQKSLKLAVEKEMLSTACKESAELPVSEAFKVNLKLWNLTTVEDVRDFLKGRNVPVPAEILINPAANTIQFKAPEEMILRLKAIIETLNAEEKRLKDFKDGLPFIKAESKPFSTFSIDTDTASYLTAKKNINRGIRPDPSKIRAEDFINYFDYHYRSPESGVFAVNMESAPAPFRPQNTLLRIGVQGKRLGPNINSASVYTVLLDTSGSMAYGDRMELAINALKLLAAKMTPYDRLSLVVCGGKTNVLVNGRMKTNNTLDVAIKAIEAGGVSDFYNGLQKAYELAAVNYRAGAWNRVVIITDGIVKLEPGARAAIIKNIEKRRINGISNIVIGLGGDGDDKLLEEIASTGDGSYVFVDSENDVKELFSANFEARFREIARDVKIQVEFNPENVAEYRQIGYENRQLSKADFRNDSVDAGEVGSGQSVTALYELRLKPGLKPDAAIATTRIRYKNAEDMQVEEKSFAIDAGNIGKNFETTTPGFKLASFAAEFAEGLEYPETQNIATPSGVAVKLRQLYISNYGMDEKVRELLDVISRVR
jgi:Ca-activated chloride channel family protein